MTYDFKHTPKAKFQNQWSLRICCHSLPERLIKNTLQTETTGFVEYKSASIEGLDRPSTRP